TGDPLDAYMWREYAADGHGFVVEFDAKHRFFSHKTDEGKRRKLLRKVMYRDDKINDFWRNPYYLFLVKETKWAFEKEWRMLRSLDQCRIQTLPSGKYLYLVDALPHL